MDPKTVIVIGPVYPYKGGIAHYTGLLAKALAAKFHTEVISYKMQYPKILLRREQKDFSNDTFRVEGAKFLLHTANPFNILRVAKQIRKQQPDAVIIEWWHPYFAPCYLLLQSRLKSTVKIIICHNVFPHERFPLDRLLAKWTLKRGNAFILHSETEAADLLGIKPDANLRVQVHPTYSAFDFGALTKEEARERLEIGAQERMLLFFGYVREYKGLKHLLRAMGMLQREGMQQGLPHLFVVGDFDGNKETYLEQIREEGIETLVTIVDGYVPDREVEKYFKASDLVVLPYESATQSGIVQIAYGFEKPVIVTDVGGLPEVVTNEETGLVVPKGDDAALADAVRRFYEEDLATRFATGIREAAYRFSWERMTETVSDLIENAE